MKKYELKKIKKKLRVTKISGKKEWFRDERDLYAVLKWKKLGNKALKKYAHSRNRIQTKRLLNIEDYDKIPREKAVYEDDIWNYD